MLRGAIVGLGNVALQAHLPGWQSRPDVEIVAVADIDAARQAQASLRLPGVRCYESGDPLLCRDDLDFVDICTPPSSHAALIERALGRGLHVLCEKPLVVSAAQLGGVTRAAAAAGRVLHTVHNWRYAPIIQRAGELLRAGAIGQIQHVVWQTLRTEPAGTHGPGGSWRVDPAIAGGGVLTDHGWHVFYLLLAWMGGAPTTVDATLQTRRHVQWAVEDTATLRLTFPEATADIVLTWAADERHTWAELTGARGTLRLEEDTLVLRPAGRAHAEDRWPCPPSLSSGSYHPEWFPRVVDDFLDAVRSPAGARGNLAEAVACATLSISARASSQRGEPVAVPVPAESQPAWT
jgi:predicted dehydrogenase